MAIKTTGTSVAIKGYYYASSYSHRVLNDKYFPIGTSNSSFVSYMSNTDITIYFDLNLGTENYIQPTHAHGTYNDNTNSTIYSIPVTAALGYVRRIYNLNFHFSKYVRSETYYTRHLTGRKKHTRDIYDNQYLTLKVIINDDYDNKINAILNAIRARISANKRNHVQVRTSAGGSTYKGLDAYWPGYNISVSASVAENINVMSNFNRTSPAQVAVFVTAFDKAWYTDSYWYNQGYARNKTVNDLSQSQKNTVTDGNNKARAYPGLETNYNNLVATHNELVNTNREFVANTINEIANLNSRLNFNNGEIVRLNNEIVLSNDKEYKTRDMAAQAEDELNEINNRLNDNIAKLKRSGGKMTNMEYLDDIAKYIKINQDLDKSNMDLSNQIYKLRQVNKTQRDEISELKKRLDKSNSQKSVDDDIRESERDKLIMVNIITRYALNLINDNSLKTIPLESNIYSLVLRLLKDKSNDAPKYIDQVVEAIARVIEKSGRTDVDVGRRYKRKGYNNFLQIILALRTLVSHNSITTSKEFTLGAIRSLLSTITEFDKEDVDRLTAYCDDYINRHS